MQINELNLHSVDGVALYAQEWRPDAQAKGVVCVVHGLGEHGGQYVNAAEALVKQDIAVVAIDLRGHGRSEGRRGHTASYNVLLDDVDALLAGAAELYCGAPRFLYGQSLGGNVVINHALRRQPAITGLIATAPWLRLTKELAWYKRIGGTLVEPFWPTLTFSTNNDRGEILEEVGFRRNRELYHSLITVRLLMSARRAGIWAANHGSLLHLPSLLIHGMADPVTDPQASVNFARQAGPDCECILLPGVTHNPHEEDQSTIPTIVDWVIGIVSEA
jgi:alpha-beta hydrolase superfamily lysophospholipase